MNFICAINSSNMNMFKRELRCSLVGLGYSALTRATRVRIPAAEYFVFVTWRLDGHGRLAPGQHCAVAHPLNGTDVPYLWSLFWGAVPVWSACSTGTCSCVERQPKLQSCDGGTFRPSRSASARNMQAHAMTACRIDAFNAVHCSSLPHSAFAHV
eukprot:361666-Chlamydomonas_euryale.AAC.5